MIDPTLREYLQGIAPYPAGVIAVHEHIASIAFFPHESWSCDCSGVHTNDGVLSGEIEHTLSATKDQ